MMVIISVLIAAVATGIYTYFKLPNQAIHTLPGNMFPAEELIEDLDETSLYGLSLNMIATENRNDLIKYMWENKKLYIDFSYYEFSTTDEIVESHQESTTNALEAERKAIDSIFDYTYDHYATNDIEAKQILDPLTWYMDYLGDSSTLLIMVSLIGMHENKPWFNSDTKVAMTASMDREGNVLPVGGVSQKTITAKSAKADVLIVPKDQLEQTKILTLMYFWRPLTVIGVDTIEETLDWLDENI